MNTGHKTQRLWLAFTGVVLLTLVAVAADRMQLLSDLRVVLHDALSPGRLLAASITAPVSLTETAPADDRQAGPQQMQLREAEQQCRQLLIENAQLRNRLRRLKLSDGHSERHARLAGFDLVAAQILSRSGMPSGLQQAMIDAGRVHGLTRSELILDAEGVLLDLGDHSGIEAGQPVLDGSVVLGRVVRAGRWVSQLLPVTDPSFSARVRLLRPSGGPRQAVVDGMLEGTGDGCRIVGVSSTASVAVGDEVFSSDINGIAGPRLYYGKVTAARFESAGEWAIDVAVAGRLEDVNQVAVVVPQLDPERFAVSSASQDQP